MSGWTTERNKGGDCMKKGKKIAIWLLVISLIVFVITWGIVGVKILDNNYEFMTEAYIALGSFAVFWICLVYVRWGKSRCPHCGKVRLSSGKYCSHCGKEIE